MRSLDIKIKYKTYSDNIVNEFYIPVLSKSISYFRAVGYFSSSILINYIKGLAEFVRNDGKMKLIISPYLTEEDFEEVQSMKSDRYAIDDFISTFETYLHQDKKTIAASKLFALLIKNRYLEVKVSEPRNLFGIYHEKIGVFIDENSDKIAIIGSNNETKNATTYNLESFNTFCSWKDGQTDYVNQHYHDFINLWEGKVDSVSIKDLNHAIEEKIIKKYEISDSIDELFEMILEEEPGSYSLGFTPYAHQTRAVEAWMNVKKGILKFATGSGKTKTAIMIMEEVKKLTDKQLFIVVVPDKTLVYQWHDEISKYSNHIIKCFSDEDWENRLIDLSFEFSDLSKRHQYIIVTNDTFFGTTFQKTLQRFKDNYMLVVDECHTWGTKRILSNLPNPKMRLGLSATPELFFSQEKTNSLFAFFGGILAEYTLEDAIRDKKLVEYNYHPIIVSFNDQEKEDYDNLTKKIVKMIGSDVEDFNNKYSKALEMLLFKRARIVYGAVSKLEVLKDMIEDIVDKGKLLIYCGPTSYTTNFDSDVEDEALTQLQTVNRILADKNILFAQYTSKEKDYERTSAIELFKKQTYSTLVAIKCLDEGVDIPIIERAIILASSTNPREFVQRRGRILRPYPGKQYSEIYDFIVFEEAYESLVKKELDRFYEFARIAKNYGELKKEFKTLFDLHDMYREDI
jgi:superfamily II DNA or RNA helicase